MLRYSNFDTVAQQRVIDFTSVVQVMLEVAQELFEKACDRQMLIRLLGLRFTKLVPGNYQIKLYGDTQETVKLYQAIDSIKEQFGEGMLGRAVGG